MNIVNTAHMMGIELSKIAASGDMVRLMDQADIFINQMLDDPNVTVEMLASTVSTWLTCYSLPLRSMKSKEDATLPFLKSFNRFADRTHDYIIKTFYSDPSYSHSFCHRISKLDCHDE